MKVKMQLGLKQGLIKLAGRKNRSLDTPSTPASLFDSCPLSLPSLTSSFDYSSSPVRHRSSFDWELDAKEVQKYRTEEGIKVLVYIADILKLPVDCIVNDANDSLQHGGGVALEIARAAGYKLVSEGDDFVRKNGKIPVGMACTTTAGNLPYDCVIHAVGPRWDDFKPHKFQDVRNCEKKLENAILCSFLKAEERGLRSIALPALSSAIFAVPEKLCAVQYAYAVLKYSKNASPRSHKSLEEIHFISRNPNFVRLIQKTFHTMISEKCSTDYNVNDYVKTDTSSVHHNPNWEHKSGHRAERHGTQSKEIKKPLNVVTNAFKYIEKGDKLEILHINQNQRLLLYTGDIIRVLHVEAVVCNDDDCGNGRGVIAKHLLEKSKGFTYGIRKRQEFRKRQRLGDVVMTSGQGTGFQYVFHAILSSSSPSDGDKKEVTGEAYKNVLASCKTSNIKSLALPILGTGATNLVSVEESVEAFVQAFQAFCRSASGKDKLTIHLVCWTEKERNDVAAILKSLLQKDEPAEIGGLPDKKGQTYDEKHPSTDTNDSCVICQDSITDPKSLPCKHVFCRVCIDNYLDNYKQACPTCGKICSIITGDQPEGTMYDRTESYEHCAGFEKCGRIEITYDFPSGRQGSGHPIPGRYYQGITRRAFLPDNKEGREILALLKIAFKRRLVFTIESSRTTGKEDVITWNGIHHKTSPYPNTIFGYPDPDYLSRVRDELAAMGVTVQDIPQLSAGQHAGGNSS